MIEGGKFNKPNKGYVTEPPEQAGPRPKILNQTCPEPSKSTAAARAFAMYLRMARNHAKAQLEKVRTLKTALDDRQPRLY
jgi:hypothetical protein